MHHIATLSLRPAALIAAAAASGSRWTARLRDAWHTLTLDADERFVRGACDLADLEWRLRRLERGRAERFGPLHPDA